MYSGFWKVKQESFHKIKFKWGQFDIKDKKLFLINASITCRSFNLPE